MKFEIKATYTVDVPRSAFAGRDIAATAAQYGLRVQNWWPFHDYVTLTGRITYFIALRDDVENGALRGPADSACECGAKKTGVSDYAPGHSAWCPAKERT